MTAQQPGRLVVVAGDERAHVTLVRALTGATAVGIASATTGIVLILVPVLGPSWEPIGTRPIPPGLHVPADPVVVPGQRPVHALPPGTAPRLVLPHDRSSTRRTTAPATAAPPPAPVPPAVPVTPSPVPATSPEPASAPEPSPEAPAPSAVPTPSDAAPVETPGGGAAGLADPASQPDRDRRSEADRRAPDDHGHDADEALRAAEPSVPPVPSAPAVQTCPPSAEGPSPTGRLRTRQDVPRSRGGR